MKAETRKTVVAFLIELVIYSILVVVYFFLVLHLLGPSLDHLQRNNTALYSLLAVGLILGQAVLLDWLTNLLLRLLRGRSR